MHFIRDALRDELLFNASYASSMTKSTFLDDIQHPQFFISQSEKLANLLNVVVYESKSATNPDALIDYLELSAILANLLDEAQFYSVLTAEELQLKEQDVQSYVSKIRTVQDAVGDWNVQTKMATPVTRKRVRDPDFAEETAATIKRRRMSEAEQDIIAGPFIDSSPVLSVLPSIEKSPTPWWTEPFYD